MQLISSGPFTGLRKNHYRVLYVDVPWKYVTWSGKGLGKSPDNHYDTMTLDEIKAKTEAPFQVAAKVAA